MGVARILGLTSAMLAMGLCLSTAAFAASGTTNGLNWSTTSASTVSITGCSGASCATNVIIPATITDNSGDYSVTSISNNAFFSTTSLSSITIPTSVTRIGTNAFYGATSLSTVTFASPSSVADIGPYAFAGATSLTSITIPTSVTQIGGYSFENATSLNSIRFSGNAPLIVGPNAFRNAPATIYRFSTADGFVSGPWSGQTLAYWLPAPTAIATDARDGTATISVTPAGFGPTPDSYRVSTVSGAGICTITPPETSCTIDSLSNGATYTFTATARTTNPAVTSDASAPTNPVTPIATPATPTPAGTTGQTPDPVTPADPTAAPRATATAPPRQTPTGIITTYATTGPGRLAIRVTPATGARDGRAAAPALCRASITVMEARTVALRCTYTAAARKRIQSRSLRASLVTVFTPTSGAATRTSTPLTLKRQR